MLETTAVLRISTSQMKASARPPERYDMQSHRPPPSSASSTTSTTGLIHAASRRGAPRGKQHSTYSAEASRRVEPPKPHAH